MRDNMIITPLVVLLLIAPFMMGAVVAAASPVVDATNDLDELSELEIEDAVYSDGDEIPFSPSPSSFGTSSPSPLGSSSSSRPFVEPLSSTNNNKTNTGIDANNTIIPNRTSTPSSPTTTTNTTTAQPTTKTNGLLTAMINGTRFTTNQTILVNGTVGKAAGSVIGLFVELKDPHNDMMAFDFAPIVRSDRPGADNETSFSYRLVAGDDGSSQDDSAGHNRRFWKPMNETGNNYTMTIGYATPAPSSPGSAVAVAGGGGEYSRSEVQFVFAYDHLLPPEEEEAAAVATTTTTTPAEEPEPEPVVEPEEPEEEESDDDDTSDDGEDCDDSYPDVCIPPPPPVLECSDIDEEDFEVRGSDPHGFDDDDDGVGCEEDSSSSGDDDDDDSSSTSSTSSITSTSRTSTSSDDDDDDDDDSSSSDDDDGIDGNRISNVLTNILDDVFD